MTLKTLKDLLEQSDRHEMVEPEELRQSAIEWIKKIKGNKGIIIRDDCEISFRQKEWNDVYSCGRDIGQISWIAHFFGITEDDLK